MGEPRAVLSCERQRQALGRRAAGGNRAPVEAPQYAALVSALSRSRSEVAAAFATLRRAWFGAVGLTDAARATRKEGDLSSLQEAALDRAIEAFLKDMAGSPRNREAFTSEASERGLIQQIDFLGWRVGTLRAADLTDAERPESSLTRAIRERLADEAFSRLTEDGRLRFEGRLGAIKAGMLDGFAAGDSPVEIARRLSADLEGYEKGRLLTIVRTEIGLASEAGIRDEFRAQGIERVEVIGDSGTDSLCTDHIGNVYSIDDADSLPLYHPNCFCSVVPAATD